MIAMSLRTIADAMEGVLRGGGGEISIERVITDSRDARPGDLFVAIRGDHRDGHDFIPDAAARGAAACVCSREWSKSDTQRSKSDSTVARVPPAAPGERGRESSPSHATPLLVVESPVAALGRLAAYYRAHVMASTTRVVAITGTNGKTTTKTMLHHVLCDSLPGRAAEKSFNNQLGVPLTILSAEREDQYLIVEIGTNAPGEVAALASITSPDVAVITSVGAAHLEGLGSIEGVVAEKASLLKHVRPDGLAVVNIDHPEMVKCLSAARLIDPAVAGRQSACPLDVITVGRSPAAQVRIVDLDGGLHGARATLCVTAGASRGHYVGSPSRLSSGCFPIEIAIPGDHHAVNAAAAVTVAACLGLSVAQSLKRLRSLGPLMGRASVIRLADVTVVDDTYNANPMSMTAAVETLARERLATAGRRVFVMGDMRELGPDSAQHHARVLAAATSAGLDVLICVGPLMCDAAHPTNAPGVPTVVACRSAAQASDAARTLVQRGDLVWVKGSRAVGLERVVSDLIGRFRGDAPRAAYSQPTGLAAQRNDESGPTGLNSKGPEHQTKGFADSPRHAIPTAPSPDIPPLPDFDLLTSDF